MGWLRQHLTKMTSIVALIVASIALALGFTKVQSLAECWEVVMSVLLGLSTLVIALSAVRGLNAWKHQERRKLALSLYQSTLYLAERMDIACITAGSVAGFFASVVDPSARHLAPGAQGYVIDESPERIGLVLKDLQQTKSTWKRELDAAGFSWGNDVRNEAKELDDLLSALIKELKGLIAAASSLRIVIPRNQRAKKSYEQSKNKFHEIQNSTPKASDTLTKYLVPYIKL